MPTDPVQVVAEARKAHSAYTWDADDNNYHCICRKVVHHRQRYDEGAQEAFDAHVNEAIVAALKAAGALMPEEALTWTQHAEQAVVVAQQGRDEARESAQAWLVELEKSTALLQEALSVLGQHRKQIKASVPTGFCVCGERWPCLRASLAEKIEKATGGEG